LEKNFYDILGIKQTATAAEIKVAYRNLAKKYHPDVNKTPEASKRFKEGHKAYAILSNAFERKLYNESLVSHKIPKDIFTQPKPNYATTSSKTSYQTTKQKSAHSEEEKYKQETIRKYRKILITKAIIKVILNSLASALGGYGIITFLQLFRESASALTWFSLFQFGGILSGIILGFIWSVDRYFKIETFIPKPKQRMFFRHFRTATFALATAYIFAFIWSSFTQFNLETQAFVTEIIFALVFLIAVTFASDGEMRNRVKSGKILEIIVIFWHNFLTGLCGSLLGLIIGSIFYLVQPGTTILHLSTTFGFIFALIIGSVAPQDVELVSQKISQFTRSFIYGIMIFIAFVLGISIGLIGYGFLKEL